MYKRLSEIIKDLPESKKNDAKKFSDGLKKQIVIFTVLSISLLVGSYFITKIFGCSV